MTSKNKIVIQQSKNNQKFAVVKAPNNRTLAHTETYKTNQGVQNAVMSLKKVIPNAVVIDKTKPIKKT